MTRLIILLILVASLPVLPFIYKKAGTGRRWTRFYLCMAMQEKKRKGFVLVMDALILSVNFLMFRISGPDLWLVPGCRPAVDSQGQDAPVFRYGILLFRVHGCQTLHSCR